MPVEERKKMKVQDRKGEVERIVYEMFPKDGSKVRWSDLEKKAFEVKMSTASLSRALKKFVRFKFVKKDPDESTYPVSVYYRWIAKEAEPKLKSFVGSVEDAKPEDFLASLEVDSHFVKLTIRAAVLAGIGMNDDEADEIYRSYTELYILDIIRSLGTYARRLPDKERHSILNEWSKRLECERDQLLAEFGEKSDGASKD